MSSFEQRSYVSKSLSIGCEDLTSNERYIILSKYYAEDSARYVSEGIDVMFKLNLWYEARNRPYEKLFDDAKWVNKFMYDEVIDKQGHSGASGTWLLKRISYIAVNGWNKFILLLSSDNTL
jgi:hypothetical protein